MTVPSLWLHFILTDVSEFLLLAERGRGWEEIAIESLSSRIYASKRFKLYEFG